MNRRMIVVAAVLSVLIVLAWWFMLWSPRNAEIADENTRRESAEAASAELQVQLSRLRALQRDEPRRRAQLELLRTAVPDTPEPAQLILAVNDLAARSGIEFASISLSEPSRAGFQTMTASFSISGGYFQVLDFINRLNELPRLVVIDSFGLSGGPSGTSFSTTLAARVFTRNQAPGAVTVTTVAGATPTTVAGVTTTLAPGAATPATSPTTPTTVAR